MAFRNPLHEIDDLLLHCTHGLGYLIKELWSGGLDFLPSCAYTARLYQDLVALTISTTTSNMIGASIN